MTRTFAEVGQALAEIRDSRLYRAIYATFEDYCARRWGFSGRRGRQLIAAAAVGTLVPIENEAQARELVPLLDEPEQLRAAFVEASAGGAATAAQVREVVARLRPLVHEPSEEERQRATARDVTLAIADAVRYLDRPTDHAARVAALFDPAAVGIEREDWTPERFERALVLLAALIESRGRGRRRLL